MQCGTDIPINAEMAIEDGEIDQVVKFAYDPQDHLATKETENYCSRECAIESWTDGDRT